MIFIDIHEYVEDQLNVAVKNFAKYLFDDTDGLIYLLHEGSDKNAILSFFLSTI